MNEVQTILSTARGLIADPAHWVKGRLQSLNDDGSMSYCLVGALARALPHDAPSSTWLQTRDAVDKQIINESPGAAFPATTISRFNDDPNTSHNQVIEVLTKAIEAAA